MELPPLYNEISHLTAILSLISKRFLDLGETDDTSRSPSPDSTFFPSDNARIDDDAEAVHLDEVEFKSEVSSKEAAADGASKQRALDRHTSHAQQTTFLPPLCSEDGKGRRTTQPPTKEER